jgi:hypothetical protein
VFQNAKLGTFKLLLTKLLALQEQLARFIRVRIAWIVLIKLVICFMYGLVARIWSMNLWFRFHVWTCYIFWSIVLVTCFMVCEICASIAISYFAIKTVLHINKACMWNRTSQRYNCRVGHQPWHEHYHYWHGVQTGDEIDIVTTKLIDKPEVKETPPVCYSFTSGSNADSYTLHYHCRHTSSGCLVIGVYESVVNIFGPTFTHGMSHLKM